MNPKSKQANFFAAILLIIMFVLAFGSMRDDSAIRDEIPHIVAGYSYLTKQDYRLNPEHPPLIKDLAAFPLLFLKPNFPSDHPAWKNEANGQWLLGDVFLYFSDNDADKMIFFSRLPIVFLAILLGFFVFKWTKELYGPKAGLLALFLYTLSPNILAHSRFVTMDLGITAFFFISFYCFWKFLKNPSWKTLFIAAFAFALCQLAKFSGIILIPIFGLTTFLFSLTSRPLPDIKNTPSRWIRLLKRTSFYIGCLFLIFIIAYLFVGIFYQFHIANMPLDMGHRLIDESLGDPKYDNVQGILHKMHNNPILKPYSQYLLGLIMVFAHSTGGHTTYFMGEIGQRWWNYYFVAYLIKEPIAGQILLYLACLFFLWKIVKRREKNLKKRISDFLHNNYIQIGIVAFITLLLGLAINSKLQLGIRYILPIFPFLYMLTAGQVMKAQNYIQNKTKYSKKSLLLISYNLFLVILLIWYGVANLKIYPSYLAYFNELIGGPQKGYKYMVDSNCDWGQDLKRLAQFVKKNNIDKIKLDYFGGGNPEYYLGEKFVPWGADKGPTTGWLAVSASPFQWTSNKPRESSYAWLESYKPVAQIGYSIFVYNIE